MKNLIYILLGSLFFINCAQNQEIKKINTLELRELLSTHKIQLIDVRSPKEINEGFINTAIFANYFEDDFVKKAIKQIDKSKPVYLYCRSGNRSGKSAKLLNEKGFDVYNVIGGYTQWSNEN
tara:strand:+ start:55 stop:420 length:366 start_codon:yes stop_codon:yes gene_type:complete